MYDSVNNQIDRAISELQIAQVLLKDGARSNARPIDRKRINAYDAWYHIEKAVDSLAFIQERVDFS